MACALAARAGLTLITGGPGTGKTTTVVRLLGLLQGQAMDDGRRLRIRLAAPTGKAAARLTESIGRQVRALNVDAAVRDAIPTEVSTLHRLLGTRPDSRHFRHHRHNPVHADLVVVDEASMIDMDMMASLLDALPPACKLILLGDKDQLASVEAGAVMGICVGARSWACTSPTPWRSPAPPPAPTCRPGPATAAGSPSKPPCCAATGASRAPLASANWPPPSTAATRRR